ncbi:hypothetical protein DOTSEDRAFT_69930, partial [Dothistroma septosporum NZE10]
MSHESWVTTSSASTMELPTKPPTGLLLRDSARGEKSRSWAKRLSSFSKRPGRQGVPVPAAVDLRAIREATTNIFVPFNEPDESLRSPARQEQPVPVLPEAEEDDYWRVGLPEWNATQAPVLEQDLRADQPARQPAPVTPPIPRPSARTPPPIGLGITLPREVHFATPVHPTYREQMTAHPRFPVYEERMTSSANISIYDPYADTSHAESQQHDSDPSSTSRGKEPDPRAWTRAPPPTHQPHHQADLQSATSTTSSSADFKKSAQDPSLQ